MTLAVIFLLLILSPLFYEVGLLCFASWQGLFGAYSHVQTPILDFLSGGYETARFDIKQMLAGLFRQGGWKSSHVITFAICWTGVLAMLLRKGGA